MLCSAPAVLPASASAAPRPAQQRTPRRCLCAAAAASGLSAAAAEAEATLLASVSRMKGRGAQASAAEEAELSLALTVLEAEGGQPRPAESPLIDGRWRLLYTSKSAFDLRNPLGARVDGSAPGLEQIFRTLSGDAVAATAASSSPIQRSITSNDAFTVYQNVHLQNAARPRVDNIVVFGNAGELLLEAEASVASTADGRRIDFRFTGGGFTSAELPFFGHIRVPYPVPFKLLGDEACGWLDTSYLSHNIRISKGNKGTTFILQKDHEA